MPTDRVIEYFGLRSKLKFDIENAQIWLDENRMVLVHAEAFSLLRDELHSILGERQTQGLLFRMGLASGRQDAELAVKLLGEGDNIDVFNIGPELHAFEGMVKATVTDAKFDFAEGSFSGEVVCENSWEAESSLLQYGPKEHTVCWRLAGHASGYVSEFFKRLVVFREVQCIGRGDSKCVLIGKPAEEWEDDTYQDFFSPSDFDAKSWALQEELRRLRGENEHIPTGNLIGNSPAFLKAFEQMRQAADTPITVLLLGETGVGKEVFARWIHDNSSRENMPFLAINCAAIPSDLIESELFGVEKGAFTGATQSRKGRFERANGGTLFLDELGELSPSLQVKLLRVLQTSEIERLGSEDCIKVDVRIIAATNVDLKLAMSNGSFRTDLYYRLATYPIQIPPLRERKSDIPLLVTFLIDKYAPLYKKQVAGISDRALQEMMKMPWPGNVRELENVIERAVLLVPGGEKIGTDHLFSCDAKETAEGISVDENGRAVNTNKSENNVYNLLLEGGLDLKAHEASLLRLAVQQSNGNHSKAARMLGLTRRQLSYRLNRLSKK
ncbi:MAG: Fis family transcriptional regulator [Neptuniibacter sp. Phe_28]|jgi:DNA-binding NtrC family response regulator|nr:MAG: Fis family transcriptional regulator [Neptuniibacter sp. Phe_28]